MAQYTIEEGRNAAQGTKPWYAFWQSIHDHVAQNKADVGALVGGSAPGWEAAIDTRWSFGETSSSASTYVIAIPDAATNALYTGAEITVHSINQANTGAATLDVGSTNGTVVIKRRNRIVQGALSNLEAGDLDPSIPARMFYDGTQWVLRNPAISDFIDEDDMASESANAAASQSSIVQYVDNRQFIKLLPNADFSIAQEGTSFAAMASGDYICDVYKYEKSGTMLHTGSQEADAPTVAQVGKYIGNSLRLECTTAQVSIGATEYASVSAFIEGYDWRQLAQRDFKITFSHKNSLAGWHAVSVRNAGSDRSFVAEYYQSIGGVWERSSVTIAASPSAGTWDYANGIGAKITFAATVGSSYKTTSDIWQTGNFIGTSFTPNSSATIGSQINIADITIGNAGVVSGGQNQQERLAHVQRYYRVMNGSVYGWQYHNAGADRVWECGSHPAPMRVNPARATITAPAYGNASSGSLRGTIDNWSIVASVTATGQWYARSGVYSFSARF